MKNKSFIDRRICLNETCAGQHHLYFQNYWSENKLILHKSDSNKAEICNSCDQQRHCAIYQCKFCDSKACFYCLTENSKKMFMQTLNITSQNNICKPTSIILQPPSELMPTPPGNTFPDEIARL